MNSAKNFINSILNSSRLVIFFESLFGYGDDLNKTMRPSDIQANEAAEKSQKIKKLNSNLIDLLKVYKLDEALFKLVDISYLDEPELGKQYLKTLCNRQIKDQHPIVFMNQQFYGTYEDLNREHEEGTLFNILLNKGIIRADCSVYFGTDDNELQYDPKSYATFGTNQLRFDSNLNDERTNCDTIMSLGNFKEKNTRRNSSSKFINTSSNCASKISFKDVEESTTNWEDTLDSMTTTSGALQKYNYKYCVNYINNNYNNRTKVTPMDHMMKATKEPGLTPPKMVLSTINNRLFKAEQAIQTKSLNILNKKIQYFYET